MRSKLLILPLIAVLTAGCAGHVYQGTDVTRTEAYQTGEASYYGRQFEGRRTASGDRYDGDKLTAAHRTLPFGTRIRVTNLANDASVVVTINDRGPHRKGRVIDVSRKAARELGFLSDGTAQVALEIVDP